METADIVVPTDRYEVEYVLPVEWRPPARG
ncbi:hypothetical protein BJY14_006831 [Actinomadura luteofluorescens]|uniref:Uncharacterized protein n=1 Tax=Actinomadura luteofluorescens TaxID=46163 RepID=A0A7Y9EN57_9ACTN|nr:hypothetical protein [Actinomadura luteofluorescens]